MAKKSRTLASSRAVSATLTPRDKQTRARLLSIAEQITACAEKKNEPTLEVPSRTLANVKYNRAKRIIEMGGATNRRQLFNLNQAKSYMQTILVAKGAKALIDQGKTTSLRGMFYMLKHTIEGTREETFDKQEESDAIIEDLEVTVNTLREELHLYAKNAGAMVGKITLVDSGRKRADQITRYPWFANKKGWQREIILMKKNDFKLEVETLISKDISYVTEVSVPERLKEEDWRELEV